VIDYFTGKKAKILKKMEKTDRKLDSGENYASIYPLVEDKSDKQICCLI
jgi:hypothetical protein